MSYLDIALAVKLPQEGVSEEVALASADMASGRNAKTGAGGSSEAISPFLDSEGDPLIPFGADPRYHWWAGGQTLAETLRELGEEGENLREADDAGASDKEDSWPGNTITGSRPGHFTETAARAYKRNRPC